MSSLQPIHAWAQSIGGIPASSEMAEMVSALRDAAELAPPSTLDLANIRDQKGLLEKLKAKWNDPKIRTAVGNISYVAAAILAVAAVAALAIHFTTGGVGGFDISLTYAAMAASFAALAVLKGLQFREEAKLMHDQNERAIAVAKIPEANAVQMRELIAQQSLKNALIALEGAHQLKPHKDTPKEKLWKGLALLAGALMLAVFIYQMVGVFKGAGAIHLSAATMVSAIGVLSYSLTLVGRFFYQQRKELAEKERVLARNPLERDREPIPEFKLTKLNERRIRLLPRRLGKLAIFVGGAIMVAAVAGLIARYGFNITSIHFLNSTTPISLTTLFEFGFGGGLVVYNGLMQLLFYRNEQEIAEEDAKIKWLQTKVADLQELLKLYDSKIEDPILKRIEKLETMRQEQIEKQKRNETIQKAVGAAIMVVALSLLLIQLIGLNNQAFRSIFHTTIPNGLLTIGTVFSYAIGIAYTGIALITNAMEHRQDIRGATLENERRALELKLRYHTQE